MWTRLLSHSFKCLYFYIWFTSPLHLFSLKTANCWSYHNSLNRCGARLAGRLDVGRLESVSTVADEDQLGRRVTRSDYLWSTEREQVRDLPEQALGGRGKKGGAGRVDGCSLRRSEQQGKDKSGTSFGRLGSLLITHRTNTGAGRLERACVRLAPATEQNARIFNNAQAPGATNAAGIV